MNGSALCGSWKSARYVFNSGNDNLDFGSKFSQSLFLYLRVKSSNTLLIIEKATRLGYSASVTTTPARPLLLE